MKLKDLLMESKVFFDKKGSYLIRGKFRHTVSMQQYFRSASSLILRKFLLPKKFFDEIVKKTEVSGPNKLFTTLVLNDNKFFINLEKQDGTFVHTKHDWEGFVVYRGKKYDIDSKQIKFLIKSQLYPIQEQVAQILRGYALEFNKDYTVSQSREQRDRNEQIIDQITSMKLSNSQLNDAINLAFKKITPDQRASLLKKLR